MKSNIFKKGVSLVLALAMCFSVFWGIGPTTAHAAGEEADVYLIAYPREGDSNFGGDWGHPGLHYMNGWNSGEANTTIVRAMDSYEGTACYCIEPGVHQNTGDTYGRRDEDYWDNYPSNLNSTIDGPTIKLLIGRILQYGYTGQISLGWRSQNSTDADNLAHLVATQLLIWETVVGERDAAFNHVTVPAGYDSVKEVVSGTHPLRDQIFSYYDSMVASVKAHTTVLSFCGQTVEMEWDGSQYIATLTDTNKVLSHFSFSASKPGIQFSVSGNKLTVTAAEAPSETVTITASKNNSMRRGVVTWTDGTYGPDGGIQDVVSYTQSVSDPVTGYLNVKVSYGSAKIVKTSEDGNVAGISFTITGNGINKAVTTDKNGEILIENLMPGVYTITEQTYDIYETQESQQVTVVSGQTATVNFSNTLKRGDLAVIKNSEDALNEGMTFHLYGTSLSGQSVDEYGAFMNVAIEGASELVDVEEKLLLEIFGKYGAEDLGSEYGKKWWDEKITFFYPGHMMDLPQMFGTMDTIAPYDKIEKIYWEMKKAIETNFPQARFIAHFSHWYEWGAMVYDRFIVDDVPEDPVEALRLHQQIWNCGVRTAIANGGVVNDHHGVGIKLGRLMKEQYGPAMQVFEGLKKSLDPNGIMNPFKMGI